MAGYGINEHGIINIQDRERERGFNILNYKGLVMFQSDCGPDLSYFRLILNLVHYPRLNLHDGGLDGG